ncbi:MAG: nitroreductase family protein [Desulfovibrio sp.]
MLDFNIDKEKCIQCCQCVLDCPAMVIKMKGEYPQIDFKKAKGCIRCQHCMTVCPTGALSILGLNPEDGLLLKNNFPEPDRMKTLIKGRRSVRRFKSEPLSDDLIMDLLETAGHAPTGINAEQVHFTVIADTEMMAKFSTNILDKLVVEMDEGRVPESVKYFESFMRAWKYKQRDVIFRSAPHMVVASAPTQSPTPIADCFIALSYFELYAQSHGVGTLWNGIVKWAIDAMLPEQKEVLGIPHDHTVGYVMVFGKPDVKYYRAVQKNNVKISKVSL